MNTDVMFSLREDVDDGTLVDSGSECSVINKSEESLKCLILTLDHSNIYIPTTTSIPPLSLLNYVIQHGRLSELVARHFARQIADGLGYLHGTRGLVHLGEYILLDSDGSMRGLRPSMLIYRL
jgi:serine/threonine protein kinase